MNVVEVELDQLKFDPRNARIHSRANIEAIKKSLQANPQYRPFVVQKSTNIVCVGNGMLQAMKELGYKKAFAEFRDLDDEQFIQLSINDNRTSEMAEWDKEILEGLKADCNLEIVGFGEEIEDDVEPPEIEDDEVPETGDTLVKRGDIWLLGKHRLLCGDSTCQSDIDKLMNGEKADLLLTDPPYGVNYEGIKNDDLKDDKFCEFLQDAFKTSTTVLKSGAAWYVWHSMLKQNIFHRAFDAIGWKVKSELVWVKNHTTSGFGDYRTMHESCFYGWLDGEQHYFTNYKKIHTILRDDGANLDDLSREELIEILQGTIMREKVGASDLHPTMKPLSLISRQVFNSTKPDELVLDIFGGSGTTLMACEELGRRCNICELDEKYASIIIKRWEEATGKRAELENGRKGEAGSVEKNISKKSSR